MVVICSERYRISNCWSGNSESFTAVVVKGTCKRLSEEEQRALLMVFKLMRDDQYEGVSDCRAR